VRASRFEVLEQAVSLTVSAGVAATDDRQELSALPERANLAKQYAKEHGRDCVSLWSPAGCRKLEPSI
jgi:hypothetical protein